MNDSTCGAARSSRALLCCPRGHWDGTRSAVAAGSYPDATSPGAELISCISWGRPGVCKGRRLSGLPMALAVRRTGTAVSTPSHGATAGLASVCLCKGGVTWPAAPGQEGSPAAFVTHRRSSAPTLCTEGGSRGGACGRRGVGRGLDQSRAATSLAQGVGSPRRQGYGSRCRLGAWGGK